jgi:hypothetical protein
MVKMIGIEFIDDTLARGTGANEGIDLYVFAEIQGRFAAHLVGVILSDHAVARRWVVRFANA